MSPRHVSAQYILVLNGTLAPRKLPWNARTLLTGQTLDIKPIRLGNEPILPTGPVYMTLTIQRVDVVLSNATETYTAVGLEKEL